MQASKLVIALNEDLNKLRVRDLIREECQNMCNLFNLFRVRSKFIWLLIEQIITKYQAQIVDDVAAYSCHLNKVNDVIEVLTITISDPATAQVPSVYKSIANPEAVLKEIIQIKAEMMELIDEYCSIQTVNHKRMSDLEAKLRHDETFNEFFRKVTKFYTYFSSGFSTGSRALFSKSQDFWPLSDKRMNLWYNEYRMFDILKKFPRYYKREYVLQIVTFVTTTQQVEAKIIKLTRQLLSLCSKWINATSPEASQIAVKSLEIMLKKIHELNKKDILETLSQDYKAVIYRTFQEDLSSSSCSMNRTQRLKKFFEQYTINPRKSLSLSEYYIVGTVILDNVGIMVLAVVDVAWG